MGTVLLLEPTAGAAMPKVWSDLVVRTRRDGKSISWLQQISSLSWLARTTVVAPTLSAPAAETATSGVTVTSKSCELCSGRADLFPQPPFVVSFPPPVS